MKRVLAAFLAILLAAPAYADHLGTRHRHMRIQPPPPPPIPWDVAFGWAVTSNYLNRGITQSDHRPSVNGYLEPRYNINPNLQFYAGVEAASVRFPPPLTNPLAEVDFYGGVRPTLGALSLDLGFIYYYYIREIGGRTAYGEAYAKATYNLSDSIALGGTLYFAPNWGNTGASGTYASATGKLTAPGTLLPSGIGTYLSGEVGRQWLGTPSPLGSAKLPDYTYWNVGFAFTFSLWTLDFRYHDTSTNRRQCFALTGFENAGPQRSNWCRTAFVATLSADLTLGSFR
jgi:uncharacterized protein (TIGR02001 family)